MRDPHLQRYRIAACLLLAFLGSSPARAREIEVRTEEFTDPDLALSPDGRALVFTVLGHLFRVSVGGGVAEQLTFGPFYDSEPAFAPDGRQVAFVSDRDGSAGNIFVLDVTTRAVRRVSRERHAGQPAWSPGGRTIAYCRILGREEHSPQTLPRFFGASGLREVKRISQAGGVAEVIAGPRRVGSVFYLPDGRLGWSVIEQTSAPGSPFPLRTSTRVELIGKDSAMGTVRTVDSDLGRIVASGKGDGIYHSAGGLQFLPLPTGAAKPVPGLTGGRTGAAFAISPDGANAFLGLEGHLVRVALAAGTREVIAVHANVKMDVPDPIALKWTPPDLDKPLRFRSVMSPQLTPDGQRLVFSAGGMVWQQPLSNGTAARVSDDRGIQRDPSLSPDGRHLAFASDRHGKRQLRIATVADGQTVRAVDIGTRGWGLLPGWSRDGTRVVFQQTDALFSPPGLMAVRIDGEVPKKLGEGTAMWTARPHWAGEADSLYFTARPESLGALFRLAPTEGAKPIALTDLTGHVSDALVSPDAKWLVFRRNAALWVAPLGSGLIKEDQIRRLTDDAGRDFRFTPDGAAVIYAAGAKVWRQPVGGGAREEIPVRVDVRRPRPPVLLVRNARVLDLKLGTFGPSSSILIADGRIVWVGSEQGRSVPPSPTIVDAAGRYAIPGLFDLHVHAAWANHEASPDAFLAYGITSVRDTGGRLDLLNALADRGELTADPLPRYFFSGEIFEGARPNWGDAFLQITREDEARAHVRLWKERGALFIKVYPSLPWPLQRAVADEARKLGLPMVGHGLSTEEIVKSVNLGYAVLEHGPSSVYDDLLQLLAATGTRWDPTLAILGGHGLVIRDEPKRLDEALFRIFVPEATIAESRGGGMFGRMPVAMLRATWKARLARIQAASARGVRLQAGTDSLMSGTFFGPSLHWELEHFAEAGITPIEILRMATQSAAEAVGAGADLGTLEPGKLADLVLLDANPLEDIRNTRSIWRVLKGGWPFDPSRLRAADGRGGPTESGTPR